MRCGVGLSKLGAEGRQQMTIRQGIGRVEAVPARGGGTRGWQRWAPSAAVAWSLVYAALGVYWAVSGHGFPYGAASASNGLGPAVGRLGRGAAWVVVMMAGLPAAAMGAAMLRGLHSRLLRRLGFDVPVGRVLDLTEALTHVDLGSRDEVFHTCRALLVQRHEQLTAFAEAFDAFWRDHSNPFAMSGARVRDARTTAARASASAGLLAPEEGSGADEGCALEETRGWNCRRQPAHRLQLLEQVQVRHAREAVGADGYGDP